MGLINNIIAKKLPQINEKLDAAIKEAGLDPKAEVVSFEENLGKVNLGITSASATAKADVTDLTGLSSLEITKLELGDVEDLFSKEDTKISGSFEVDLKTDLSAHLGGSVEASAMGMSKDVGIGGSLSNSGTRLSGTVTFGVSDIKPLKKEFTLNTATVEELNIHLGETTAEVDGLGFFNDLLNGLQDTIVEHFQSELDSMLSSTLKDSIQKGLDSALPMHIGGDKES